MSDSESTGGNDNLFELDDFDFDFPVDENGDVRGNDNDTDREIEFLNLFDDVHLPSKVKDAIAAEKQRLSKAAKSVIKRMDTVPYIKLRDKLSFTIGVCNVALTAFFCGAAPHLYHYWHTQKAVLMLGLRWYLYRRQRMHYFLFDYCYFLNFVLLAYLWVFPQNERLFRVVFAMAMGPLAWAIVAWRNSLVFHSLDKLTSIFIHISPPILCWCLRWNRPEGFAVPEGITLLGDGFLLDSCLLYLFWQVLYAVKVYNASAEKVREKEYATSYNYLMKNKDHPVTVFATRFQSLTGLKRVYGFMLIQFAYTLVTLLLVPWLYSSFWFHTAFIFFVFVVASWNGSVFYTEIFATRYVESVEKRRRRRLTTDVGRGLKEAAREATLAAERGEKRD